MKIHYETSYDLSRYTCVSLRGHGAEYRSWFNNRMTAWQRLGWAPELISGGPWQLADGEWCAVVNLQASKLSMKQLESL